MTARLTDEELTGLQRIIDGDDGVRPIMFPWMDRALAELKERRAADLSAEEVESLKWLQVQARAIQYERVKAGSDCFPNPQLALAILDRLIAGGVK